MLHQLKAQTIYVNMVKDFNWYKNINNTINILAVFLSEINEYDP